MAEDNIDTPLKVALFFVVFIFTAFFSLEYFDGRKVGIIDAPQEPKTRIANYDASKHIARTNFHCLDIERILNKYGMGSNKKQSEICQDEKDFDEILIDGPIIKGDYDAFKEALVAINHPVWAVYLRSPGGNIEEAIKIGLLIRKLNIRTKPPNSTMNNEHDCGDNFPEHNSSTCICASACFLIYVAGAERDKGHVLIHRPYLDPDFSSNLEMEDAYKLNNKAKSMVREYLNEMEVQTKYVELMFSTPSNETYLLPEGAIPTYPSAIEERIIGQCGMTLQQYHERHKGDYNELHSNLFDQISICEENFFRETKVKEFKKLYAEYK